MILNLKGEKREFADGMNALDIAGEISQELKKAALAARLDGEVISLVTPIHGDHDLEILTFDDPDGARVLRHTASHVLAQAVKKIIPEAKLAIGPAIDNGFYYDFDVDQPFTPEILKEIEKEMSHIVKKNERLERFELPARRGDQVHGGKGRALQGGADPMICPRTRSFPSTSRATLPTCAPARICPPPARSRRSS